MGPNLQSQISGDLTHLFSIPLQLSCFLIPLQLSCELELINIEPPPPFVTFFHFPSSLRIRFIISRPADTHDYHLLSIYFKSSQQTTSFAGRRDAA